MKGQMEHFNPKEQNYRSPVDRIKRIYVQKDCAESSYIKEILGRAGNIRVEFISEQDISKKSNHPFTRYLAKGKQELLLCNNKGRFFKSCPGTKEYVCCGYQVLNIGMNCPMDCVYCILQAYLNNPLLSFFVNVDDLLVELDTVFKKDSEKFWRIGTGEFTDSLALDRLTGLSRILVNYIGGKKQAILELKTKTAEIDNLRDLQHHDRTIVAWSLNSPQIIAREELHTASLEQRLAAAAQCSEWGYKIAFHFDPIIYHQDWREGYAETIDMLFRSVPKEKIVWISLGCLRFLPSLRTIAGKRFPNCRFFAEEFVEGLDGKIRYFRTQRIEMYRYLYEKIQQISPETFVYLCMESDEIWQDVFQFIPDDRDGLTAMLNFAAQGKI